MVASTFFRNTRSLMGAALAVFLQPAMHVDQRVLDRPIDLLAECHPIALVQPCLLESLTDPVGLGMPSLRPCITPITLSVTCYVNVLDLLITYQAREANIVHNHAARAQGNTRSRGPSGHGYSADLRRG